MPTLPQDPKLAEAQRTLTAARAGLEAAYQSGDPDRIAAAHETREDAEATVEEARRAAADPDANLTPAQRAMRSARSLVFGGSRRTRR